MAVIVQLQSGSVATAPNITRSNNINTDHPQYLQTLLPTRPRPSPNKPHPKSNPPLPLKRRYVQIPTHPISKSNKNTTNLTLNLRLHPLPRRPPPPQTTKIPQPPSPTTPPPARRNRHNHQLRQPHSRHPNLPRRPRQPSALRRPAIALFSHPNCSRQFRHRLHRPLLRRRLRETLTCNFRRRGRNARVFAKC